MHTEVRAFLEREVRELPPPAFVVDLGGRDVNGSPRDLFNGARYLSVDLYIGPGVDVLADAAEYSPISPPDLVLCLEVLEHTEKAEAILANAHRMLAPGGVLLLTCATDPRAPHSGIDGGDPWPSEFYRNVPRETLEDWLELFVDWKITSHARGDLYAVARKAAP